MSRRTAVVPPEAPALRTVDARPVSASGPLHPSRRPKAKRVGGLADTAAQAPLSEGERRARVAATTTALMSEHLEHIRAGLIVVNACLGPDGPKRSIVDVRRVLSRMKHVVAHWTDEDRRQLLSPSYASAADLIVEAAVLSIKASNLTASFLKKHAHLLDERREPSRRAVRGRRLPREGG